MLAAGHDSSDQSHDLAEEVREWQMANDCRKKNQKRKQGQNEIVRQRRRKRRGVILFHVANHIDRSVLEME